MSGTGRSTAVLEYIETVEPLLRRGADLEIDTRAPLEEVVDRVLRFVGAEAASSIPDRRRSTV